jgi:hypothetical protein
MPMIAISDVADVADVARGRRPRRRGGRVRGAHGAGRRGGRIVVHGVRPDQYASRFDLQTVRLGDMPAR